MRSSVWQKNLVINIIIGIFLSFVILEFLVLGLMLDKILLSADPDGAPELLLEKGLVYYYFIFFFFRFYLQSLPVFDLPAFLHLPVKKSKIIMFMQLRSLTSFFNFVPLIIFMPFAIKYMGAEYDFATAFVWFSAIMLFEITSNFTLLWLKRKSSDSGKVFLAMLVFFALVFLLEKYRIFSFGSISMSYFEALQSKYYLILLPLTSSILMFYLSYRYLLYHSYIDDIVSRGKSGERLTGRLSRLESMGDTGRLILNEIKLLLRNKRSKSILYIIPLSLMYGLFFYGGQQHMGSTFHIFVGIFITGGFLISYGQYILAWESTNFDFLQTANIQRREYFRAKYYLLGFSVVIAFVLSTPYVFYGKEVLLANTVAALYNIGVNVPFLLFAASYNRKRMELSKSASFNYQGVGVNNFLIAFPLVLGPMLLFYVVENLFSAQTAMIFTGALGLAGILLHKKLIDGAVRFFEKNRYKIMEGFREP